MHQHGTSSGVRRKSGVAPLFGGVRVVLGGLGLRIVCVMAMHRIMGCWTGQYGRHPLQQYPVGTFNLGATLYQKYL